jgi:metallo-beta-lactamase class B
MNIQSLRAFVITADTFQMVPGLIEVYFPGAGHTQDNVVVWLAKSHLLFGGGLVLNPYSRKLGYIDDASIKDWPQSIQNVLNKYPNIDMVIPRQGQIGDISLLLKTQKLARKAQ